MIIQACGFQAGFFYTWHCEYSLSLTPCLWFRSMLLFSYSILGPSGSLTGLTSLLNRTYYELSNYVVVARLLQYVPYHAPVHPGRSISTINSLNILIMTLICSGAPQSVNTNNNSGQIASGKALLKTALLLQLAVMVFLVSVAARWQWNCSRSGKLLPTAQGGEQRNTKRVLSTLYCSCALITCCTIFRTVEYFEYSSSTVPAPGAFLDASSVSPVIRYEWFFWVFDATVMLCNSALWSVRHPARDLPRSERTYLAEDGTERQGLAIEDPRRCWVKVLDPYDIRGLVMGYHEKWWEVGVEDTSTRSGARLEE